MSLRTEIFEQPEMLRALGQRWPEDVHEISRVLEKPTGALFVGRGTSDNAARYAQYVLGIEQGLPSALATPSIYSSYEHPHPYPPAWLILAISQSGASPDLAAVVGAPVNEANQRVAITNTPDSLLASVSDFVIPIHAGTESAVAATKTYTASLCAVLRLSDALSGTSSSGIDQVPEAIERVLAMEADVAAAAARVADMGSCAIIGRGLHMSTAFEWALKVTETSALAAVPFSSADFLHGPVAMIDTNRPLLAVIDDDPFTAQVADIVHDLSSERRAETVVLSFVDDAPGPSVVRLPDVGSRMNPLVAAAAFQLFSLHLALARGTDPDSPRGLSKITETL